MNLFSKLKELPLIVQSVEIHKHERDTSSGFLRKTTEFILHGDEYTGRGEDVTYEADEHDALEQEKPDFSLTGEYTLTSFSDKLEQSDLFFGREVQHAIFNNYRRLALESAALDLALKQAGTNLADALNLSYKPVRFVVSTRLGDPPSTDRLNQLIGVNPDLEFKLDPTVDWSTEIMAEVANTNAVRILDFKGLYSDTIVDNPPEPRLYQEAIQTFPDVIIEDPADTPELKPLLNHVKERLSWDYPIRSIQTIKDLPYTPKWINIKPSRFGSLKSLLDTIEYCQQHDITMYGGGQFELSIGRGHIQGMASIFYPDSPNDVAPGVYNFMDVDKDDVPLSPLTPSENLSGLEWTHK